MKNKIQKKPTIIFFIFVVVLIILFVINLSYTKTSTTKTKTKYFISKYGSFELEVPDNWECVNEPFFESTDEYEGSPDGGMRIRIDDDSFIYIRVSRSRNHYNGKFQESIITNDGLTVKAYSYNNDGRINEIIFTDFIGVVIKVNNDDVYDMNKKNIIELVKSIKLKK